MPTASAKVRIENKLGLHARPAMMLVTTASRFQSVITVKRADQSETLDGKSIMHMMMLAATPGTEIELNATGEDADDAIAALTALIKTKFNEE